jgi:hypothetical protein
MSRPSPTTGISFVALLVALGGTSYAISLPRNSVSQAQISPGGVGKSEIRADAVGRSDFVRARSRRLR